MKVEGWESMLAQYLNESESIAFEWGMHDCALWACDWVYMATGRDLGADWRGRYSSAKGAYGLMKKRGFSEVAAIANSELEPVVVRLAQRGDLVLHEQGNLGICNGFRSSFLSKDGGLVTCKTVQCLAAWKVD